MTWRTPAIIAVTICVFTVTKILSKPKDNILGESVEMISPSVSAEPSPTENVVEVESASLSASLVSTASATQAAKPKPKALPTPKPQPEFKQEDLYNFTEKYGQQYGVDPNVLRHIAICESGFTTGATNGKYAGMYQFDEQTWIKYRGQMTLDTDTDLRWHGEEAIRTAAFTLSKRGGNLWPNCYPK